MPGPEDATRQDAPPNQTPPLADAGQAGTASPAEAPPSRYALGEEIAHGGMGVVHRATDTRLGRGVAVKVLQGRFTPGSAAAHRFDAEARITAQLQHPASRRCMTSARCPTAGRSWP